MRHKPAATTRRGGAQGRPSALRRRSSGPVLFRYVFREPLLPGLLALAALTAALLAKDLLGFSDLVINRGLGLATVARIALYEAVPLTAWTLPFASLVGVLVGLGRLASDRELLALEACGISWRSLLLPVACGAALATAAGLALSLAAGPWAARSLDRLLEQIARERPATAIRAGTVLSFDDWKLEAREASASGEELRGVLLWMPSVGETIFAEEGSVKAGQDGALRLRLRDGAILLRPRRSARSIRFETLKTELPQGTDLRQEIEHDEPLGARGLGDLRALAQGGGDPQTARRAGMELHRRFALPFAALAFGILAVPLFLVAERPSGAGGAVAGLAVTVAYYGLLQMGNGLVHGGTLGTVAGAWLPNAAALAVALVLLSLGDRIAGRRRVSQRRQESRPGAGGAIRMRRFPLERYVAARFLALTAIALAALVAVYLITDVLERLDWFARHRAETAEVLRFYAARTPLLASRMVPMAFLAGTALAVSRFAMRGELLAMRCCGIAAVRGLLPVLLLSALAVPADFLLADAVVTRTNALADHLKVTEIEDDEPRAESEVFYRSGDRVLRASSLDPEVGTARDVSIYEMGEDGLPRARTDAASARHLADGLWELREPRRIEISTRGIERVEAPQRVALWEDPTRAVDPMHFPARELAAEIREAEAAGYDATRLRVDLHAKLATPFACLVLSAAVLFLAVAGPPFPGPARILLFAIALGVGFVLLSGMTAAIGYGGAIPPAAGGWGAVALFALLAAGLATRNRT